MKIPTVRHNGRTRRCAECNGFVRQGDILQKDIEMREWIHPDCLAARIAFNRKAAGETIDQWGERVSDWRDGVIDTVKCPKCGSQVGAPCYEMGKIRHVLHKQRVNRFKAEKLREQLDGVA